MNERFELTGRTVIITGGGKGIGKVYTQEFARAGARVVAVDIDGAAAKGVAEALAAEGFATLGLTIDIASEESTTAMAQAALDRFGAIDVLVNNASLMSVLPRRSWLEIPVEEWDRVMAVNLRGMFLSCRAVFPAMKARQRGKIVNISSSRVWDGTPNRLHYTTSKAGAALGKHLVLDLQRIGARALEHLHRAHHVHGIAEAGVGIDDDRAGKYFANGHHVRCKFAHCHQPDIGDAKKRVGDTGAGHVSGGKTLVGHDAGSERVGDAGQQQSGARHKHVAQVTARASARHRSVLHHRAD